MTIEEVVTEKLKQHMVNLQEAGCSGQVGTAYSDPIAAPNLVERINRNIQTAERSAMRHSHLLELKFLLEKNPSVARILDLLDILREVI